MYYIDPPYFNTEAGYNSYWSKKYEQDLYNYIIQINNIGSSFMISGLLKNDGTDSEVLLKLIKDGFYYDELKYNYNKVSKVGDKHITEIIIYNYK
jgi:site-specific DNA-adenine methylase